MPGLARVLAAVALLAAIVWFAWPVPTDEDRVRDVIRAVIAGAEAGDVGDVLEHVSDTFQGRSDEGSFDAPTLRSLLVARFMRHGPIAVFVAEIKVKITGDQADASFDALLTERGEDWTDIIPINADGWHLEVGLAREADGWKISSAERSDLTMN